MRYTDTLTHQWITVIERALQVQTLSPSSRRDLMERLELGVYENPISHGLSLTLGIGERMHVSVDFNVTPVGRWDEVENASDGSEWQEVRIVSTVNWSALGDCQLAKTQTYISLLQDAARLIAEVEVACGCGATFMRLVRTASQVEAGRIAAGQ